MDDAAMKPMALTALALLIASSAGAPASAAGVEGRYRLVGEQDVASELLLTGDGRFAYGLAAGALDEQAEGRWTSDGKVVKLTTEPTPKPAEFTVATAARTSEAPLRLRVTSPDGHGIAGVDFVIGFDSGPPTGGYTQEYGWTMEQEERRLPQWIELSVPMYSLKSQRFPIDATRANDLGFVLIPNDLGTVDFEELPLIIEPDRLVMQRYGGSLTYVLQEK